MKKVHTIIVGSGAAGLNAAIQLKRRGIDDILIVTEALQAGTSYNAGSDKQTYYKLATCGDTPDSPVAMARGYLEAGSMHGDLALIECALSSQAFFNLVDLGVNFPHDKWGQFIGYKTDHDPASRATSVGPYTSREMCRALQREVERLNIKVEEDRFVHQLLTMPENKGCRACGVIAVDACGRMHLYAADNVVFAVGGAGGLYKTSVYPEGHNGAIGVALAAGALAQNLPESQFGIASLKFRWNLSGTYMQCVPRFVSTAADGRSDRREFLADFFGNAAMMCSNIFLKGYQWPFDARRALHGSSMIDLLVYIETVSKGRRVFLDFSTNARDFDLNNVSEEARNYLVRSGAVQTTPVERLDHMNPAARQLYLEHNIDLRVELLEIAVCAQHNNGGLAANEWWESLNIKHFFPIGEVNGSHGVARPGGSALNAGQVGGMRAAEYIAARYFHSSIDINQFEIVASDALRECESFVERCHSASRSWREVRAEIQNRMSSAGALIRSRNVLQNAVSEARALVRQLDAEGCSFERNAEISAVFCQRQLCYAHLVYLESILYYMNSEVGSRGSALVVEDHAADSFDFRKWRVLREIIDFRGKVLESCFDGETVNNHWAPCRPLPSSESWFESAWADYSAGKIYE